MPLEYLLRVMRDPKQDDRRRASAAKAAAPYLHAKLRPQVSLNKAGPNIAQRLTAAIKALERR
jgi:hypothetical protein